MKRALGRWATGAALGAALLTSAGCVAAVVAGAAAGAGAGAGIYLTSRGASSLVDGSVDAVSERTLAVFDQLGIARTSTETHEDGTRREYRGTRNDMEVSVELSRESAAVTRVSVNARRGTFDWQREYAKMVLQRIVERGGS